MIKFNRHPYRICLLCSLLLFMALGLQAQDQRLKQYGNSIKVVANTAVTLYAGDYRGTLMWQESYNGQSWVEISGQNRDSLQTTIITQVFYRVGVKEVNCDWLFAPAIEYELIILPTVLTNSPENISSRSIEIRGQVTDPGNGSISSRGFCLDSLVNPDTSKQRINLGSGSGHFSSVIGSLEPGTDYFVRAFAQNEAGLSYGISQAFTTLVEVPQLETLDPVAISDTVIQIGGQIHSNGGDQITSKGICWASSQNPDTSQQYTAEGAGSNSFISTITGLSPNTRYYFRAYAINSAGISYGNSIQAITQIGLAKVNTLTPTDQSTSTVMAGGEITHTGGGYINDKGLCWGISSDPTLSDSTASLGQGNAPFTLQIEHLLPNTEYFIRAYATNQAGVAYGQNQSFTTRVDLATIQTLAATDVGQDSAKLHASVDYDGYGTLLFNGFCWDTVSNPDTTKQHIKLAGQLGQYSQVIRGLSANTNYFFRSFTANEAGLVYGGQQSFTTLPGPPVLGAIDSLHLTDHSVIIQSSVVNTSGLVVDTAGFCWALTPMPDTSDHLFFASLNAELQFEGLLDTLSANTSYYIRAFATNAGGINYSEDFSITTKETGYHVLQASLGWHVRNNFRGWKNVFPLHGNLGNGYSGITLNWDEDILYIVGNNAKAVWAVHAPGSDEWDETNLNSNHIKTIPLNGYVDPEGINYLGNGWFMLADEGLREVSFVQITSETTQINKNDEGLIVDPTPLFPSSHGANSNRRLEGIAYDFHHQYIYGICEKGVDDHPRLYRWKWKFDEQVIDPTSGEEVTDIFNGLSDQWIEGSDLFYHPLLQRLYVLSGFDDKMAEYYCPHPDTTGYGQFISQRQLPRSNGTTGDVLGDCEGICLSPDGLTLYLVYEDRSFGYGPVPFIWYYPENNLPATLFPFSR